MKKYFLEWASLLFALMMSWVSLAQTRELTGNSMITTIQGTVLGNAGTAHEMLSKVPGMTQRDDKLEVVGKGAPVFYVNGRKV